MSVPILKGIHRRVLGLSKDDQIIGRNGFVAGGEEKPGIVLPGSPDTVAVFDDFIGDTGRAIRGNTDELWRAIDGDTGTDTGSNIVVTPATGGVLRITNGDTPKADARLGITGSLSWKGNQGAGPDDRKNGLRFGVRLKATGFHDTEIGRAHV